MYRELQPLRKALLFPAAAGADPKKLLETYLDRLTMYTGVDVADQTCISLTLHARKETLGSPEGCANEPDGFQRFIAWLRSSRQERG